MEIFVPKDQVKEVFDLLAGEKVSCEVTDKEFDLMVAGKKIAEVTTLEADLLETDVPVIYDQGPEITLRAFRLPSGGSSSSPTPTAISSASSPRRRAGNVRPHQGPGYWPGPVSCPGGSSCRDSPGARSPRRRDTPAPRPLP